VGAGLLEREPEEVQRALHVHVVGRLRDELGARREDGGEMEDGRDLELGAEPVEEMASRMSPTTACAHWAATEGSIDACRGRPRRDLARGEAPHEIVAHLPAAPVTRTIGLRAIDGPRRPRRRPAR
jgi:hypothetical protein